MLHCMTNFATNHEKCTTKITKQQKYTMSLFLYKVYLSNYIKIYLEHIMNNHCTSLSKLIKLYKDLFTAYNVLTTASNSLSLF